MSSFGTNGVESGYNSISRGNAYADRAAVSDPMRANSIGQYAIPGPSVTVAPRSRQVQQIPQVPAPISYQTGQNNGAAMNAQEAEKAYLASQRDQWYQKQQQQFQPQTQIPGSTMANYPPSPGGTQIPSPSTQPVAPTQIPSPSAGAPRMTMANGQSYNGGIPSPSPALASSLPAYGQLSPTEQKYTAGTSAIGTLRGSFQAHDASGNAIPGQYKSVDASAPRDLANLQANARYNGVNSRDAQQAVAAQLENDPKYAALQQQTNDVQAATAAKMPVSLYQQHQALLNPDAQVTDKGAPFADGSTVFQTPDGKTVHRDSLAGQNLLRDYNLNRAISNIRNQQDIDSLSPKDRLAYQQKQAADKQKGEQDTASMSQKDAQQKQQQANEDRRFKQAQDKQTIDALGGLGKFAIGAAKQFGDWWTKSGQLAAKNAKTDQAKADADRDFHLKFENTVNETWKQMIAKNPKLTSDDYDKMRRVLEKRIYGKEITQDASQETPAAGATAGATPPPSATTPTTQPSAPSATTQPSAPDAQAGSAPPQSTAPVVNEGTESTSKKGRPIVFTGGKWVYKS